MFLTFRYRLMPSRRQHRILEAILEAQRQLYNAALEERIDAYRKAGITRTLFDQQRALTEWRRSDPEGAALPVKLQRWTLKQLDVAFKGFFRRVKAGGKPGFPRFRGKGRWKCFGFEEFSGIHLTSGRVTFKGMPGALRVHMHRAIPEGAPIRACHFYRDPKGWLVGFEVKLPDALPSLGTRAVGVDLGISTFAALSDGGFIPSLRSTRRTERRLKLAQRALSRKVRGSRGCHRARASVVRCHADTARARADHLHQASARLIRDYDIVVIEKLNFAGLARSALAKDIHDASWAKFIWMLRYKAACAGTRLLEVNPNNTSQACSGCGTRVPKELSERLHQCSNCGLTIDRDLNAARNILNRGGVVPGLLNVAATRACVQAETSVSQRDSVRAAQQPD